MTEQELLTLPPKAAAQYIANCPDNDALPLLLKYAQVNRYAIDWMLGQVRRVKGTKPPYHDEALQRSADAWYGSRSSAVSAAVSEPGPSTPTRSPLFGWGIALVTIGVLAIIISFFFDVGIETGEFERVANINLISIREMICWCGGFLFLGGLILLSGDRICSAVALGTGQDTAK